MDITLLEIKQGTKESLISLKNTITDYLKNRKFNNNCITLVKTLRKINRELWIRRNENKIIKAHDFSIKGVNKYSMFINNYLNDDVNKDRISNDSFNNKIKIKTNNNNKNNYNNDNKADEADNKENCNYSINKLNKQNDNNKDSICNIRFNSTIYSILKNSSKLSHFITMNVTRKNVFYDNSEESNKCNFNINNRNNSRNRNNDTITNSNTEIFNLRINSLNTLNSPVRNNYIDDKTNLILDISNIANNHSYLKFNDYNDYNSLSLNEEDTNNTEYLNFKDSLKSPVNSNNNRSHKNSSSANDCDYYRDFVSFRSSFNSNRKSNIITNDTNNICFDNNFIIG